MATAKVPINCMIRGSPPTKNMTSSFVKIPSSLGSFKSISKTFGLKSHTGYRATAMATYKIKFIGPDGTETEFEAPDDAYLLDSAESAGLELPYSCRSGACSTCATNLMGHFLMMIRLRQDTCWPVFLTRLPIVLFTLTGRVICINSVKHVGEFSCFLSSSVANSIVRVRGGSIGSMNVGCFSYDFCYLAV